VHFYGKFLLLVQLSAITGTKHSSDFPNKLQRGNMRATDNCSLYGLSFPMMFCCEVFIMAIVLLLGFNDCDCFIFQPFWQMAHIPKVAAKYERLSLLLGQRAILSWNLYYKAA
jgi:hypothetical protein